MKSHHALLGAMGLWLATLPAPASTFYVNLNNPNPQPPYGDWSTAATNIQVAIDAANNGDQIWVTNGVYQTGGRVVSGSSTNRIALTKAVTVQSVNGPWMTIIQGGGMTTGATAIRCAWLTNNAALIGFTLMWGGTPNFVGAGGGVWCNSTNALVANCVIVSNTASFGGGAYQGTLDNCLVCSNNCQSGGGSGTYDSLLLNCTVINNANGAMENGCATNCIIYFNSGFNYGGGTFSYCCTTPAATGTGNFTNAPQLFTDGVHLATTSPCIGAGANVTTGTDIFGNAWASPPSVGCAEEAGAPVVAPPLITLTGNPVGFMVGSTLAGQPPFTCGWLENGVPLQNNGHFSSTQTTNLVATGVSFADAGGYQLVVTNISGVVTSAVAQLVIHCVNVAGTNPMAPYLSWQTAATNIQNAIDAAAASDVVLVTNGLYAVGGESMDGATTNRVSVNKAILVQSVNGPVATVIQGAWDPAATNGPGAVRCVSLTNTATLSGFALRGGATPSGYDGGGVYGSYPGRNGLTANVANCYIAGNAATQGGGADGCNLMDCVVTGNYAQSAGGGTASGLAQNCAIGGNSAGVEGGGACGCTLINCTITGNATLNGYNYGGGVYSATLTNCIVYGNQQVYSSGNASNYYNCTFSFSCTSPLPAGSGNISANPQLLADGIHLSATSPCIGAGTTNMVSGADIDGQPWKDPPSIGCDEWYPAPVIGTPLSYQINWPAHGLTFNVVVGGQAPFNCSWSQNGVPIQDNGHFSNSGTVNLVVNNFGPSDAGSYQVVVTNSFGSVTSQVAQVVIHAVNAAGVNPVPPYSAWATAAATIQDAINVAAAGDIVLVTNGIYSTGGLVMSGNLTNRVAVTKPVTVTSVNGPWTTIIQGAWDPVSTNGPDAVRCAYLTDGATLYGFTLKNGATLTGGLVGDISDSGGGAFCTSTNAVVSNCVLTNNSSVFGGGICQGTLNNSLVVCNLAPYGGGAYESMLNNCTVVNNYCVTPNPTSTHNGGGTYDSVMQNTIVTGNFDGWPFGEFEDNYYCDPGYTPNCSYSCTYPLPSGAGNINANNADQQFLDCYHIATTSPCCGAGSPLYASGTDLDGNPWNNPPSMGCAEVVVSILVGPLAVNLLASPTNLWVSQPDSPLHLGLFQGLVIGQASRIAWSFGGGPLITNLDATELYWWTTTGVYTVIFTAYNNDNPGGVSTNVTVFVSLPNAPQLQSTALLTNAFQFQFPCQSNVYYSVQYATDLTPPVVWQDLPMLYYNSSSVIHVTDSPATNAARFYRVLAQ